MSRMAGRNRREEDFRNFPHWIKRNIKMKVRIGESIRELHTDAAGMVEFRGVTRSARAKFVRLSDSTPSRLAYNMMIRGWKMDQPRLLVSVIGGDKSFNLKPDIAEHFASGLSKIAQTPGAWIISGGTNSGVARYVGSALQGCTNSCIGVCPWGMIAEREALKVRPRGEGKGCSKLGTKRIYYPGSWLTDPKTFLEHNHTHFLLVDNGKVDDEDLENSEVRFRMDLERYIVTQTGEKVPNVLLVVEGDFGIILRVYSSLVSNRVSPIVVVKGSGKAADLLVYTLQFAKQVESEKKMGKYHQGLVQNIYETFPQFRKGVSLMKKCYLMLLECLKCQKMFTVTSLGADDDISEAIFKALLSDIDSLNVCRQLTYTLMWKEVELAKEIIFNKKAQIQADDRILHSVMIMALASDYVEFVEVLLDYGFNMMNFLTNDVLEFLYGIRSHSSQSPLKWEIPSKDFGPCHMTGDNGKIYMKICEQEGVSKDRSAIPRRSIEKCLERICDGLIKVGNETFIEDLTEKEELLIKEENVDCTTCVPITFKYPFSELFFWAVLNNMQEMALFLWKFEEQPIAKALLAAEISHELYEGNKTIEELEKTLSEMQRIFMDQAVKVLDQCYKTDEKKTSRLITSFFYQFEGMNALNLAVSSNNQKFVSHGSVQGLLNDIWTGHMWLPEVDLWQITLAIIFPWRIRKFEFKTEEEIDKTAKVDDEVDSESESDDDSDSYSVEYSGRMLVDRPTWGGGGRASSGPSPQTPASGTQLPFWKKLVCYYSAPVVKFMTSVILYFVFLLNYCYFAMQDKYKFKPKHDHQFSIFCLPPYEFFLLITVFAYFVAEVHQVLSADAPTYTARFLDWASSAINIVDVVIICAYFVGTALRIMSQLIDERYAQYGHLVYAVDCGLWILRLLHIFHINPTIGPYVVMIVKMVKDLVTFLTFLGIAVFAFGVVFAGVLFPKDPNDEDFSVLHLISDCVWQPYFKVYGLQFVSRERENNVTTRFNTPITSELSSYEEYIIWILQGFYQLLTNILLLNLLIAVFNCTYNEVSENSDKIWKFERFSLIKEYTMSPTLPPPFSLISHFILLVKWFWFDVIRCKERETYAGFKTELTETEKADLLEFECHAVTQISRDIRSVEEMSFEDGLEEFRDELEKVKTHITSMKDLIEAEEARLDHREKKSVKKRQPTVRMP